MHIHKRMVFIRFIALLLAMAMVAPTGVQAAGITPRASSYLDSYNAYIYLPGDGEVQVYFRVEGTSTMDELGALTIMIYESINGSTYSWKKTFSHDTTPGLLSYNDDYHSGCVSYSGVEGRSYKAYICVWGGKNGEGDSRYFWAYPA